jgi:methionyl aminopeptidase
MIVHGIPGSYELGRGDILSLDVGVILDGWIADAAVTVQVGNVTPVASRLLATTKAALFDAVERCRPGARLGDVSHTVQARVEAEGFSVIRALVGHGIGRDMHEDPQIPNYGEADTGVELEEGMVLAIEPMTSSGTYDIRIGSDDWAVYSRDGSLAAHFEHTVAVTAEGPRILTPWHAEEAQRAA